MRRFTLLISGSLRKKSPPSADNKKTPVEQHSTGVFIYTNDLHLAHFKSPSMCIIHSSVTDIVQLLFDHG